MPPEPLPSDRRDLVFRDRKHEKGPGSDGPGGSSGSASSSAPRWRDPHHWPRDLPRASPRRSLPGHYRQSGGYHQLYPDESGGGHGSTPSRSSDRFWSEDESFRPSSGRHASGSRSVGRESRGSFRRSPYWDSGGSSRQQHREAPPPPPPLLVTGLRSVAVPITSPLPLKDHHDDKPGDGGANDDAGTGNRTDPDHSLGSIMWKPLKWSRPGSLSLPKTTRSEPYVSGFEALVPSGRETPVQSMTELTPPAEEGHLRKKQRLGWGEGLAKYEKKIVEGSEDGSGKGGLVQCPNGTKNVLSDTSPKTIGLAGCASPATSCSIACSSSPGVEDKLCLKSANIDNGASHYSDPSCIGTQNCLEEFILNSLLADLLQPEDASSGDSSFTRHTAMSKLLVLKGDISKELEKTENEIDLLESELKSLNCNERIDPCQGSFATQADEASELCADTVGGVLNISPPKDHLQSSSTIKLIEESILDALGSDEHHTEVEGTHADSSEMVSSKVDEAALLVKGISDSDAQQGAESPDKLGKNLSGCTEVTCSQSEERVAVFGPNGNSLEAGSSSADANIIRSSCSKPGSDLIDLIMASNRDVAKRASQVFDRFMPAGIAWCDLWALDKILSNRSSVTQVREKLAKRRNFLRFKEQVLAIRYRAAYNLWREDLHLLYMRKQRPKSQKRFDLSNCLLLSGSQKRRSSLRSRFISTAGNPSLVPTTEMLSFTSKLMSDSQIKINKNTLKMPAYVLSEERRHSGFITNNGLIEDPVSFEKERAMINPWMQEEKELFMEMLATFGKKFTKIASFLKHKTTADCIELYYKNHKSESFEEVKKRLDLKKQLECLPTNTYLVTAGKKWKCEANAASPNMLGTAAVVQERDNVISRVKQIYSRKPVCGSDHEFKVSRGSYDYSERTNSGEILRFEGETAPANVLAGICCAVSSGAVSSCITSSIDPAEKINYRRMDRPLTPEGTCSVDEEETCSDEGCGELDSVDWTNEEKSIFMRALSLFGKDFGRISCCVGSRSREQCKIFFSKARKCLGLDAIYQGPRSGGTPKNDTNGERSDAEDACDAEMDSGVCSTQSCSKVDADFTQSVVNTNSDGFVHPGKVCMIDTERASDRYGAGESNEEEVETKFGILALEFSEGKLASNGDLLSSGTPRDIGDIALSCNEYVVPLQVSNPPGNTEVKKVIDSPGFLPGEPCISSFMELERLKSPTSVEKPQKDIGGRFPADQLENDADLQQFPIQKIESEDGQQMKMDTDHNANENLPGKMVGPCPCPASSNNYQHKTPSELFPYAQKKSLSVMQENAISVPVSPVLPDPSSICFRDHLHVISGSTLDFEKHANKKQQNFLTREFYRRYVLGKTPEDQVDQPLHILRGYPLQVLDQEEAKKDSNLARVVLVENDMKKNGILQQNRNFGANSHAEKCNVSRFSHSRSEILCPSRSEELSGAQLRPRSQSACSETEVQSKRTGEVKLFGKILSHPSSMQKSKSASNGNKSMFPSPKQSRSSTMKLLSMPKGITMTTTVPESSGNMGMEEVPLRSGFWDGNRIQSGFSKLPESAILLAKCQGSLGGVSFYPTRDGLPCSDAVLAGYDMAPGLQQQSRAARLSMNLVGGGGIVLGAGGGSCSGVSDPVAAIKMHYAVSAKILKEVDS